MKDKPSSSPAKPDPRSDRLAAALRENLARRKVQARARKAAVEPAYPQGNTSDSNSGEP